MTAEQLRHELLSDMDAIINAPRLWVGSAQRKRATACRAYLREAPPHVAEEILRCYNLFAQTPETDDMSDKTQATQGGQTHAHGHDARAEKQARALADGFGLDFNTVFMLITKYGPVIAEIIRQLLTDLAPKLEAAHGKAHGEGCPDHVKESALRCQHAAGEALCAAICTAHCCGAHDHGPA